MRKYIYIIMTLFITILLFAGQANAQKVILVKKMGTNKNEKFYEGNYINFKYVDSFGSVNKLKGIINVIENDFMIVNNIEIDYSQIKTIYVPRPLLYKLAMVTGMSGVAYIGLTGLSNLVSKEKTHLEPADYAVASTLVFGSGVMSLFLKKKYRLDKSEKYKLEVLDFNF